MSYIVITVILTAVCAAYLFAQEADEVSKEMDKAASAPDWPAAGSPRMSGPVAAAGIATAYGMEPMAPDSAWKKPAMTGGTSGGPVAVRQSQQMEQWKIRGIRAEGKVNLERHAAKSLAAAVETGEVK